MLFGLDSTCQLVTYQLVFHTLSMSCVLPVSDGQLETHVPDHMIAKARSQGHPVLQGIHSHRQGEACNGERKEKEEHKMGGSRRSMGGRDRKRWGEMKGQLRWEAKRGRGG